MPADDPHDDRTQSFVALTAGTKVSHYNIIEKIGSGGMGEVYLAEDTKLNRKVALKFLPSHLCQDENCRKRFKREAQAVAKLSHPNVVTIYEVSEHHGRPFFAMEHVEGLSLKEFSAAKDPSIERILELGIQRYVKVLMMRMRRGSHTVTSNLQTFSLILTVEPRSSTLVWRPW